MNDAMLSTILGLLLQCSYTVVAPCPSPLPINTLVDGVAKNGVIPANRAGQIYTNGIYYKPAVYRMWSLLIFLYNDIVSSVASTGWWSLCSILVLVQS